jgi:signal transduction histidine kinase
VAVTVCLALSVAASLLAAGDDGPVSWKLFTLPVVWAVPGALIVAGRPRIAVGWLMLGVGLIFAVSGVGDRWVAYATAQDTQMGVAWAIWFTERASAFLVLCGWLALLLLPNGHLPSPRWRPVVWAVAATQAAVITIWSLVRGPAANPDSELPAAVLGLPNPVGVLPAAWGGLVEGLDLIVLQLPLLLVPVALAVRLRRAGDDERPGIAGILLAATVFVILVVTGHALWPAVAELLDVLGSILLAAALVSAVLRRRIQEIDVVVHAAFVYALLTALIAGAYVAATSAAASLGSDLPPFGAGVVAAAVALALLPLRGRLQRWVERLLHGDRGDHRAALRRLADSAYEAPSVDEVLTELATTVAISLRVPWAGVAVPGHVAEHGRRPRTGAEVSAPLTVGDSEPGTVSVIGGPGRRLGRDERRLLGELGRHGGVAVQAVVLAAQLLASRQQLVTAREEERRRLSRDLHDELGPTLAGLSMQLGTVRGLVDHDPGLAVQRLSRLQEAADDALAQVRRVARALRPPALDELGLVGALRHLADSLGLTLHVASGDLPPLPAAAEVAGYRIAAEALSNVARHAGTVQVRLSLAAADGALTVCVSDDGQGHAGSAAGVGLLGMQERAAELGGTVDVRSAPGAGTVVTAVLPVTCTRQGVRT